MRYQNKLNFDVFVTSLKKEQLECQNNSFSTKSNILLFLRMMYTEEFINELVNCPKIIVDAPRDSSVSRGSHKRFFSMISVDSQHYFSGFISVNTKFSENFSIGLVYIPKTEKGKICLLRCNGLHGETIIATHHSHFHIHRAIADDINNGIKVERQITETTEYATIDDAIQFYLKLINLIPSDRALYFPRPSGQLQLSLDEQNG